MAKSTHILNELAELESILASDSLQDPEAVPFAVPEGYFDGLAGAIMLRIHALEAVNPYTVPVGYFEGLDAMAVVRGSKGDDSASPMVEHSDPGDGSSAGSGSASGSALDELAGLSPLLSGLGKKMPFNVPQGYFEGLETGSQADELSPLLSSLKGSNPYKVPAGYFDELAENALLNATNDTSKVSGDELAPVIRMQAETSVDTVPVVRMGNRSWIRYAAAAVVIAFVAVSGFFYLRGQGDDTMKSSANVTIDVKGVPAEQIDQLIKLADEDVLYANNTTSKTAASDKDVERLMKNVPEKEIQDFLNDADAAESDIDNDIILN